MKSLYAASSPRLARGKGPTFIPRYRGVITGDMPASSAGEEAHNDTSAIHGANLSKITLKAVTRGEKRERGRGQHVHRTHTKT